MSRRFFITLILVCCVLLCGVPAAALAFDLYFVRHAETMSNATGRHNRDNEQTFSSAGKEQVAALTESLVGVHLDAIVVSPLWRAQHTIVPFLEKSGRTAEIWPELAECCWQKDHDVAPSQDRRRGALIVPESSLLSCRDEAARYRLDNSENYADGVQRVKQTAALLRQRFAGTSSSVLVVGHYWHGAKLLAEFLGWAETAVKPGNGQVIHLRQGEDGAFRFVDEDRSQ